MEKIKVCLKDVEYDYVDLVVSRMALSGNSLYIKFASDFASSLVPGDRLKVIRRFEEGHDNIMSGCKIVKKISDSEFLIEQPSLAISPTIVKNYKGKTNPSSTVSDEERDYYNIYLESNLFVTDDDFSKVRSLSSARPFELYVYGSEIVDKFVIDDFVLLAGNDKAISAKLTREEFDMVNVAGNFVRLNNNPYYYIDDATGECGLWNDNVVFFSDTASIKVPIIASEASDISHLHQEELVRGIFEGEFKDNTIPHIIDLEKVKYSPAINRDGVSVEAKKLKFVFHFRNRVKDGRGEYTDDWKLSDDATKIWESFNTVNDIKSADTKFFRSDLLSRLNFQDTDVRYQKDKLKKSFIRLSFYNSKSPMSQSLLYYSTVFFDSTALYSRYNAISNTGEAQQGKYVDFSGSTDYPYSECLTSEIDITSNLDYNRSSEGFYLYLFGSDAPAENTEKTIYMKVEFNHAKYGRTFPMVVWPFSGNTGTNLTTSNYFDSVYIPVTIKYNNGRYLYYFGNGVYNDVTELGDITFVLFEPVLTA